MLQMRFLVNYCCYGYQHIMYSFISWIHYQLLHTIVILQILYVCECVVMYVCNVPYVDLAGTFILLAILLKPCDDCNEQNVRIY